MSGIRERQKLEDQQDEPEGNPEPMTNRVNDLERVLLQDYVDGTLAEERLQDVSSLLENNATARRFVAEHQVVWDALGDAFGEPDVRANAEFREQTLSAAERSSPKTQGRWRVAGLAAAALLAVAAYGWITRADSPLSDIPPADREVVMYLHVLQSLEVAETYGPELDLRGDFEIYRAFEGERDGEG
jgi:anti-sigma-K factor RskA